MELYPIDSQYISLIFSYLTYVLFTVTMIFFCHNSCLYMSASASLECPSSFSSSDFSQSIQTCRMWRISLNPFLCHHHVASTLKQIQLFLDCFSGALQKATVCPIKIRLLKNDIICFSICPPYESVDFFFIFYILSP